MYSERWDDYRPEDLVWARLVPHRSRVERAVDVTAAWLVACQRPYVAVSGGKDSVAMLAIVQDAAQRIGRPPIDVMWHDSGVEWPHVPEVFDRLRALGLVHTLHIVRPDEDVLELKRRQMAGELSAWKKDELALFGPLRRYAEAHRLDAMALGLRSGESAGRAVSRATHGLTYRRTGGMLVCTPIADWLWQDVFAFIAARRLPLHPIYSAPLLQLEHRGRIRLSWWASTDHHRHGELTWVRVNYPQIFARLCAALPGVGRLG